MPEHNVSWMGDALCAEIGPRDDIFFPKKGQNTQKQVKKICDFCEVKAQCEAYAVEQEITYGWWGSLSPTQLKNLYKTKNSLERGN